MAISITLQSITFEGDAKTKPRVATVTHDVHVESVDPFSITVHALVKPGEDDSIAVEVSRRILHYVSHELSHATAGWAPPAGGDKA